MPFDSGMTFEQEEAFLKSIDFNGGSPKDEILLAMNILLNRPDED